MSLFHRLTSIIESLPADVVHAAESAGDQLLHAAVSAAVHSVAAAVKLPNALQQFVDPAERLVEDMLRGHGAPAVTSEQRAKLVNAVAESARDIGAELVPEMRAVAPAGPSALGHIPGCICMTCATASRRP